MRKSIALLLCGAFLTVTLSACGSKADDTTAADAAAASETVTEQNTENEPEAATEQTTEDAAASDTEADGASDTSEVVETPEEPTYTVESIKYERSAYGSSKLYATITAYDADGNEVWNYRTADYDPGFQLDQVSEIGLNGDHYYLNEDKAILCFDREDGSLLWKNEEFGGYLAQTAFAFGEDGTLYISGYMGPDLFAVDKDGNTLARVESYDSNIYWPYDASLEGSELTIIFENMEGNDPLTEVISIEDYSRIR